MDRAAGRFAEFLQSMRLRDPSCVILSTIDQREITGADELARDLVENINHPINWLGTMERLIGSGVDTFIECGPGKSLHRIARFIEGDFETHTINTLRSLIGAPAPTSADIG